jgi:hypothetical protein
MQQLEALCIQLGISEHIPALSELRDDLLRDKTEAELDAEYVTAYPHAESYQVRAWLIRNSIDPASIPALITSLTPFGPERQEALMRWEYAVKIPANHPLVTAIASSLNINLKTVWPSILEL